MTIKPLPGFICVEETQEAARSKSGIYIPDDTKAKQTRGIVIAVGEDFEKEANFYVESPVKTGEKVLFREWGNTELKDDNGKKYQIVKFEDILAVLE